MWESLTKNGFLSALHYVYPATVFLFLAGCSAVDTFSLRSLKGVKEARRNNTINRLANVALTCLLVSYLLQLIGMLVNEILVQEWTIADHLIIGRLSCVLVFGVLLSQRLISYPSGWCQLRGTVLLALIFETAIFWGTVVATDGLALNGILMTCDITISLLRITLLASAVLGTAIRSIIVYWNREHGEEREALLPKLGHSQQPNIETATGTTNLNTNGYGSTLQSTENGRAAAGDDDRTEVEDDGEECIWDKRQRMQRLAMEKRLKEHGNWFQYAKEFMIMLPYVWPFENRALQLRALGVVICIFANNAFHLLIPRQTGIIMDSFNGNTNTNPWMEVGIYAALRLASSECGIQLLRQWFWLPVKYFAHEALSRAAFSHIMHLSADFHDSKSSSDMLMAIHGGTAISNVTENIFLQAVPMLVDLVVAIIYLSLKFGPFEGFITVATGMVFLHCATILIDRSKNYSRKRRNALYQEYQRRHAGLLGWQTVSAFNQIGYEDNRHADAVTNRWLKEQQYIFAWQLSIALQTIVLTSGLLASSFLAVHLIQAGKITSGQFAMLLMYWAQLTSPLQFFASLGKSLSDDLIDAERLLDVMKTKPSVANKVAARPLKLVAGNINFENVCFSYDGNKKVIHNLNMKVAGGQRIAFVGATGAGKSTLLKLIFRYYDVNSGGISIDGQDIRDVDIFSLRERIGIVPQSPVLFDDTIINNVRYAKVTASDEEVFEACRAACIHDKILGFTKGYNTKVGERGVKLSGGELQRVAIARAILKNPDIVLLDEATSAVDTDTEQYIQESFDRLCRGRTTFVVAHRLSTIKNADRIVVVEGGCVIEQGTHDELILQNGRYANLWSKQGFGHAKPGSDSSDAADQSQSPNKPMTDITIACPPSSSTCTTAETTQSSIVTSDKDSRNINDHSISQQLETHNKTSTLNPVAVEFTPKGYTSKQVKPTNQNGVHTNANSNFLNEAIKLEHEISNNPTHGELASGVGSTKTAESKAINGSAAGRKSKSENRKKSTKLQQDEHQKDLRSSN